MTPAVAALPPLREDLRLHRAAADADGAPAWVIEDPVVNRYFRIGWLELECLLRWGLEPEELAAQIRADTPLAAQGEQVLGFAAFLEQHRLLRPGPATVDRLAAASARAPWSQWRWWLHHYLFFRVPLVRPQYALARLARRLDWLFRPWVLTAVLLLSALGLLLTAHQWDVFLRSFVDALSPEGLLGFAAALVLAKTAHELGHALVATRLGVRVGHMGVAFVVLWPMLYTDTGESWRLSSRRQRLAVSVAGIATELALAGLATLGWALAEPGAWRNGLLYLATTSWVLSLALNASPFMRFDGYFILCDLLDFPNLHERSGAQARAWLRRHLLGLAEPYPEGFPCATRRWLIAFAFVTWLYRFAVFLAIAVAVYLLFFKALGIVLFAIEILWFVVLPVWRELRVWGARRAEVPRGRRWAFGLVLLVAVAALAVPWKTAVRGTGFAQAERHETVYAPFPSRLVALRPAGPVRAGDRLALLEAPDLDVRGEKAVIGARALGSRLTTLEAQTGGLAQRRATVERLGERLAEARSTRDEIGRLTLRAGFDGDWRDLDPLLAPGAWVGTGNAVGALVDPARWVVDAYVDQGDVERLAVGAAARFYREGEPTALRGIVTGIDTTQTARLAHPMLATRYGGPVAVARTGDARVPTEPRYRVRVALAEPLAESREAPGTVIIEGARRSPLAGLGRGLLAALIRESGF